MEPEMMDRKEVKKETILVKAVEVREVHESTVVCAVEACRKV